MDVVYETEPPQSIEGRPGPLRQDDYFALPDEPRCELVWGHLVVTPAPTTRHQFVLLALTRRLADYALAQGHALLFAPTDVVLFDHSVLQPDLLMVRRERREIVQSRVESAPDLAVEVVSRWSARYDRRTKLDLYARAQVGEYWIVDPEAGTIDLLELDGVSFRVASAAGGRYRSRRFPDLELDLVAFWDEVDRWTTGRRAD